MKDKECQKKLKTWASKLTEWIEQFFDAVKAQKLAVRPAKKVSEKHR
jgi:hypothetical protein